MIVDEENMTVQVNKFPEYTEYVIDADLSEFQEEASQEDDFNLSDPFTQMFLQQMVFEFEVIMPGEIVEAGGHSNSMLAVYNGDCDFATAYFSPPLLPTTNAVGPTVLMIPKSGAKLALARYVQKKAAPLLMATPQMAVTASWMPAHPSPTQLPTSSTKLASWVSQNVSPMILFPLAPNSP